MSVPYAIREYPLFIVSIFLFPQRAITSNSLIAIAMVGGLTLTPSAFLVLGVLFWKKGKKPGPPPLRKCQKVKNQQGEVIGLWVANANDPKLDAVVDNFYWRQLKWPAPQKLIQVL
ncbi:MAG: hypothetical protein ABJF10_25105 [Chthoniobacter sp.]|uniref:hypothetical protein n=1 Tax=Chthoniobacter sp. TaxID=2510640 RepID=UPI0032AAAD27